MYLAHPQGEIISFLTELVKWLSISQSTLQYAFVESRLLACLIKFMRCVGLLPHLSTPFAPAAEAILLLLEAWWRFDYL